MANIFKIKRSNTSGVTPTSLNNGELAINTVDGYLFYGSASNTALNLKVQFANITNKPTTLAGYGITDASLSNHTHTFASLTSKPTTLAGYGITDSYTQAQTDTALAGKAALGHTHAFNEITSKPTTLDGYGITDSVFKWGDIALNRNSFSYRKLYTSVLDNALFLANRRWTTTLGTFEPDGVTPIATLDPTPLFNSSAEDMTVTVPMGKTVKLNINFGGSFPGYPYGRVILTHYYLSPLESATLRVYCNHVPQGVGWKEIPFTVLETSNQGRIWQAINPYYNISEMEIVGVATATKDAIVAEVEFFLDRATGQEMSYFDKYRANNIYSTTNFIGADKSNKGYITNEGVANFTTLTVGNTPVSLNTHTHTFASLTSKPTTLAGYGITDAFTTGGNNVVPAGDITLNTGAFNIIQPVNNASWARGLWLKNLDGTRAGGVGFYGPAATENVFIGVGETPWLTKNLSFHATTGNATFTNNLTVNGTIKQGTTNVSLEGHTQPFSSLTALPNTLAAHGITDTYTASAVQSRGMNLVTNGTGLMGTNYNFTNFTFYPADTYVGGGSFMTDTPTAAYSNDELLPVLPDNYYKLKMYMKSVDVQVNNVAYGMVVCFDVDGQQINPSHYTYYDNITVLAQPLKVGDTTVYVNSVANWNLGADSARYLKIHRYKNAKGYVWPEKTYSRHVMYLPFNAVNIDSVNNKVTLNTPWTIQNPESTDKIWPIGTPIGTCFSGGTYLYPTNIANTPIPDDKWTLAEGVFGGLSTTGSVVSRQFPQGTAFIKVGGLFNRMQNASTPPAGIRNKTLVSGVYLTEIAPENLTGGIAPLSGVQDINGVQLTFTKGLLTSKAGAFANIADAQITNLSWTKVLNKPTTLAGYGITDSYTKAQVDSALATKSDIIHVHTFASITSKPNTLSGYGVTDSYTKTEVDSKIPDSYTKAQTYTKAEVDTKVSSIPAVDAYTKAETDSKLATKADTTHVHTFDSITSKPTTLIDYGITDAAPLAHVGSTGNAHGVVSHFANGFMSSSDKFKLDLVSTRATATSSSSTNGNIQINSVETPVYVHPSNDGNLHVPETGTTNNGKLLKSGATSGSAAWGTVGFSEITGRIDITQINTVGTPSAKTYLAGDGSWRDNSPRSRFFTYNDFMTSSSSAEWVTTCSGIDASLSPMSVIFSSARLGLIRFNTGSTNTANYHCGSVGPNFTMGLGVASFLSILAHPTLSNDTDTYTTRVGFIDSKEGDPVNGVFFRYSHNVNSGKWQAVCKTSNFETVADTGISPVAGVFQTLSITCAQSPVATFFINGIPVGTISSNIPRNYSGTGYGVLCKKTVGTTPINALDMDYMEVEYVLTTPR